ncbi:MAG: chemotaxis protein CheW [Bacteroidetes bacterium]|nr:chemotaxis protein CheW [Bacteroidota bacterium]
MAKGDQKKKKEKPVPPDEALGVISAVRERILEERAERLKTGRHEEERAENRFAGLELLLGMEHYIIDHQYITEVIHLKSLTPLPCTPDYFAGIINVRGKIFAVISLKKFLNLPESGLTNDNLVILLRKDDIELGILVDEVIGNCFVYPDKLQIKIAAISGIQGSYITGVTEGGILVFNTRAFMEDDRIMIDESL